MILLWSALPPTAFLILWGLERLHGTRWRYSRTDVLLNLTGFLVQGLIIPFLSYAASQSLLPRILPHAQGIWPLGLVGAFLLNIVVVDLLYYWEHRVLHAKALWPLHQTHHNSPGLDVWATSRNSLIVNGLFVYLLINPWLGYLCDRPEGLFAGAMATAALDLWRHTSRLTPLPLFKGWLTRPIDHHRHHDIDRTPANYGANFIVWDRLFGTADLAGTTPQRYAPQTSPAFWPQFLAPFLKQKA